MPDVTRLELNDLCTRGGKEHHQNSPLRTTRPQDTSGGKTVKANRLSRSPPERGGRRRLKRRFGLWILSFFEIPQQPFRNPLARVQSLHLLSSSWRYNSSYFATMTCVVNDSAQQLALRFSADFSVQDPTDNVRSLAATHWRIRS